MNAKTTRILKEARPLFWPWCAVVLASALALLHPPRWILGISSAGLWLGVLLLPSLAFGNEFEHRTLSLLLSQPVSRMEIWREKLAATVAGVASAVLIFYLAGSQFRGDVKHWALTGAGIIAITASATFWTLFTRSTVGGAVLNAAAAYFIFMIAIWVELSRGAGNVPRAGTHFDSIGALFLVGYAGVMLWLGRRKLARFQTTGGVAGDDLLTAGPDVLPGVLVGWLRCRSTGAVLNLIRKEFRLLRPVWLISLLAAVAWVCLTGLRMLHLHGLSRYFESAVAGVAAISTLIIAILAGSLPLGEEKTSGTLLWHLTLPVSARRQWFIKLCMALFAGFIGACLVPLFANRFLHLWGGRELFSWLIVLLLLTFAAFWCACAVKGTVPTVLWVLPVMLALYYAAEFGRRAGSAITALFFSRLDPFANLRVANAVSWLFKTFAISRSAFWEFFFNRGYITPLLGAVLVPTLVLAVIQSYRLFRAQLRDSALSLVRNLLPLAMVAFLCSFSLMVFFSFAERAQSPESGALLETIRAIQKLPSRAAKLDAAHPLQFTVEDLAKASPLSKSARRWLGDSHITLSLEEPPHQGRFGCAGVPPPSGVAALGYSWYTAIVPLADGTHLFMAFDPVTHQTISFGLCK
jgi:hypothetical protein